MLLVRLEVLVRVVYDAAGRGGLDGRSGRRRRGGRGVVGRRIPL